MFVSHYKGNASIARSYQTHEQPAENIKYQEHCQEDCENSEELPWSRIEPGSDLIPHKVDGVEDEEWDDGSLIAEILHENNDKIRQHR